MKNIFLIVMVIFSAWSCSSKLLPDYSWQDKRWIVVELKEVPVQLSGTRRDAYLTFMPGEKRFNGNAGCNTINGAYKIEKSKIYFSEIISTKMSCPDISFETVFLQTLDKVNRYEVSGNTILLKRDNDVLVILKEQ
jgi:heat shock protein HslJ